jgi:hypothetical protein
MTKFKMFTFCLRLFEHFKFEITVILIHVFRKIKQYFESKMDSE